MTERDKFEAHWKFIRGAKAARRELMRHPEQPQTYIQDSANRHWVTWQAAQANMMDADGKQEPVPFTCADGSKCKHGWWCSDTYCQGKCEFRKAPVAQKQLTDEQIEALGHRIATKYTHRSDPASHSYGFVRHTLIDFARAIEKHGIGETSELQARP